MFPIGLKSKSQLYKGMCTYMGTHTEIKRMNMEKNILLMLIRNHNNTR